MEAHPPIVGLVPSETRAVDSRLLASAEADDLAIERIAYTVGLGVFDCNGRNGEVSKGRIWEPRRISGSDD